MKAEIYGQKLCGYCFLITKTERGEPRARRCESIARYTTVQGQTQ